MSQGPDLPGEAGHVLTNRHAGVDMFLLAAIGCLVSLVRVHLPAKRAGQAHSECTLANAIFIGSLLQDKALRLAPVIYKEGSRHSEPEVADGDQDGIWQEGSNEEENRQGGDPQ